MVTNGGTYGKCVSYKAESLNVSLLGMRKYVLELDILIFIEQESERIVSYRGEYMNWGVTFCTNSCHGHIMEIKNMSASYTESLLKPPENFYWISVIILIKR